MAQQNLRSILSFCNSPQMGAPEACIQFTPGLISADGEINDPTDEQFRHDVMIEFAQFIVRALTVLAVCRPREG